MAGLTPLSEISLTGVTLVALRNWLRNLLCVANYALRLIFICHHDQRRSFVGTTLLRLLSLAAHGKRIGASLDLGTESGISRQLYG